MGSDTRKVKKFAPRIVSRLRILFASVCLILILSFSLAVFQIRALNETSVDLTNSSLPVFVSSRQIESHLKNLLLSLQRRDAAQTVTGLRALRDKIEEQLRNLQLDIDQMRGTELPMHALDEMTHALGDIANLSNRILETDAAIMRERQTLSDGIETLLQSREEISLSLEELAYENASISLEKEDLDRPESNTAEIVERPAFGDRLLIAAALTELSLQIETVLELASSLRDVSAEARLVELDDALSFRFHTITLLVSQLPETVLRENVARNLLEFRKVISGTDGIRASAGALIRLKREVSDLETRQIVPILEISERAKFLTDAATSAIDSGRAQLSRTAKQMTTNVTLAGVITMILIAGGAVVIVERQINRRMAKLTQSVLTIAGGKTDGKSDVSGPDELGDMARALEVFKENAKELHRSNNELEKFAYVAAHDLRSPLRAIRDLAQWTVEDDETKFSADSKRNIDLLQRRIERMDNLLSDLLEYSRVGKELLDLAEIDLEGMVKEIAGMLDPDEQFEVRFAGINQPVVTYATPLRQILLNLLSNAIKHHDRRQGTICVIASYQHDRCTISVTDDGPGIDPRYHRRVFELFKTLKPRDQVEGSGLGLAIINKMVIHFGGSVVLTSDPATERGTTFTFDLPIMSSKIEPARAAA